MLDMFGKRATGLVNKYIKKNLGKFKRLTNTKKYMTMLFKGMVKKLKDLISGKPSSLKDYLKIGQTYIAKKLLVIIVLVSLVILFIGNRYIIPWMEGRFWTPKLVVNSAKYYSYTGKAKVYTQDEHLLYLGEMEEGRIMGRGHLYSLDGNLRYSGDFVMEQYHGLGEHFRPDGSLLYRGEFASNQYNGQGEFFEDGILIYDGQFKNGLFEGAGAIYHPNGNLKYRGSFAAGHIYGHGKLYDLQGRMIYQGDFQDGYYQGTGIEYEPSTGMIIYEGQYKQGKYHGLGQLYYPMLSRLRYEGEFRYGVFSGEGSLYNNLGKKIYHGHFFNGQIDFYQYVDMEVDIVRDHFGAEEHVQLLDYQFLLLYESHQVVFALNYADITMPQVERILFWGDQEILSARIGLTMDQLSQMFGEPYSEAFLLVEEDMEYILPRLSTVSKEIPDEIYAVKYQEIEGMFIRFFFLEPKGKAIYFELGGV